MNTVKITDKIYKVTAIADNVLKGTAAKTVTVKTSKLTKRPLQNLVKNSKAKAVKLFGASKAPKGVTVR